jgi:uncharacterized protein GlcG (DUF336 family)
MDFSRLVVCVCSLPAFSASVFAQGLPTQKVLTMDVAQEIAHEAITTCRAQGFRITVLVVDSSNELKALLRDDGASMGTLEFARLKTNTVILRGGNPSGPPRNLPPGAPIPPPPLPNTTNAQGGLPIKVGNELIGAVGVSGTGAVAKDAGCANAGLVKVADKLK